MGLWHLFHFSRNQMSPIYKKNQGPRQVSLAMHLSTFASKVFTSYSQFLIHWAPWCQSFGGSPKVTLWSVEGSSSQHLWSTSEEGDNPSSMAGLADEGRPRLTEQGSQTSTPSGGTLQVKAGKAETCKPSTGGGTTQLFATRNLPGSSEQSESLDFEIKYP